MSIEITASITSKDDIIISLGHSSRGVYEDLTEHIVFEISEAAEEIMKDEEKGEKWVIEMVLPYPHSQASGDLTLSVGDSHSGDITTTQLIIKQDGEMKSPYFDPLPRSVDAYPGQDVLINTESKGSAPISVSVMKSLKYIFYREFK